MPVPVSLTEMKQPPSRPRWVATVICPPTSAAAKALVIAAMSSGPASTCGAAGSIWKITETRAARARGTKAYRAARVTAVVSVSVPGEGDKAQSTVAEYGETVFMAGD